MCLFEASSFIFPPPQINISYCERVTDDALHALALGCRRLRKLVTKRCLAVSSKTINFCKSTLHFSSLTPALSTLLSTVIN